MAEHAFMVRRRSGLGGLAAEVRPEDVVVLVADADRSRDSRGDRQMDRSEQAFGVACQPGRDRTRPRRWSCSVFVSSSGEYIVGSFLVHRLDAGTSWRRGSSVVRVTAASLSVRSRDWRSRKAVPISS